MGGERVGEDSGLLLSVTSSDRQRDKARELIVFDRCWQGFTRDMGSEAPIPKDVEIDIHRQHPPSKNSPWFEVEVEETRGTGADRLLVRLYPTRIDRDMVLNSNGIDEGGMAERIGEYLRLWVFRRRTYSALLEQDPELAASMKPGVHDELWKSVMAMFAERSMKMQEG